MSCYDSVNNEVFAIIKIFHLTISIHLCIYFYIKAMECSF